MPLARVLAGVAAILLLAPDVGAQFTPGNLAVLRTGNGTTLTSTVGAGAGILQFDTTGKVVSITGTTSNYSAASTPIVTLATGGSGIVFDGGSAFEGGLNRATDGSTLVVAGYAAAVGTTVPATNRTVARVTAAGIASYQGLTSGAGAGNIRSVATIDAGQTWLTGTGIGAVTATAGGDTATTVAASPSAFRSLDVFGTTNALFGSTSSTSQGVYRIGTGSAPTSPATANLLLSNGTMAATGFWMADRAAGFDYGGTGLDTAYVLSTNSMIYKFEFDGGNWVGRGTIAMDNRIPGVTGLAGAFLTGSLTSDGKVELFATFDVNGQTSNNYLVKVTDAAAFTASNPDATLNWSVAAESGYSFRGVDSTPTPVPEPAAVLALAAGGLAVGASVRRRFRRGL